MSVPAFTFIYATGSAYLSVETEPAKKLLKIGCLGMAPVWSIPDYTWDFTLTEGIQRELDKMIVDCGFESWDECYVASEEEDLDWELILDDGEGNRKRSFGQGMKSDGLDIIAAAMKDFVTRMFHDIHIDLATLEAVYFCHVYNGINCTCTLYRDLESVLEKTKLGEKKFTLSEAQWNDVVKLVADPSLPHMGFGKEKGSQFVSRALYLGGKMVSYTYGGTVDSKWDVFEEELLKSVL